MPFSATKPPASHRPIGVHAPEPTEREKLLAMIEIQTGYGNEPALERLRTQLAELDGQALLSQALRPQFAERVVRSG